MRKPIEQRGRHLGIPEYRRPFTEGERVFADPNRQITAPPQAQLATDQKSKECVVCSEHLPSKLVQLTGLVNFSTQSAPFHAQRIT